MPMSIKFNKISSRTTLPLGIHSFTLRFYLDLDPESLNFPQNRFLKYLLPLLRIIELEGSTYSLLMIISTSLYIFCRFLYRNSPNCSSVSPIMLLFATLAIAFFENKFKLEEESDSSILQIYLKNNDYFYSYVLGMFLTYSSSLGCWP